MNQRLHITVIVCTRDRRALLEQCLSALSNQTYPNFEILVVDNAPRHPVRDICLRYRARYIVEPAAGLTHARNTGAHAGRGEVFAYTDDDAVPDPGWLAALAAEFDDPAVGAVTGSIHYFKARGDTREMSDEEATNTRRPYARFDRSTPDWFTRAALGGVGDGGNMAFRRSVFDRGIGFDMRLGRGQLLEGGDEHVIFATAISQEHAIVHTPDAIVRHPTAGSEAAMRAEILRTQRTSIAYLLFLWAEFPGHRRELARFVAGALHRRLSDPAARWPALRACLGAPILYWRARRRWANPAPANQRTREGGFARSSS